MNAPLRIALVTGASGAIGEAIARQIAATEGHGVVLVGRHKGRIAAAAERVAKATDNRHVRHEVVDLSRQADIQALRDRWSGPLHILVNNAAETPRSRLETAEGIERQFASNVLGYFWMMTLFEDLLRTHAPSRVVNVASYWAGGLDLDDLQFQRRPYDNDSAYRQSKQANRMLTVAFANQVGDSHIAVNACHPGDVNSKLSNDLGFGGHESPDAGARTPAWLATTAAGRENTGRYFEGQREKVCRFGQDSRAVEALWRVCSAV